MLESTLGSGVSSRLSLFIKYSFITERFQSLGVRHTYPEKRTAVTIQKQFSDCKTSETIAYLFFVLNNNRDFGQKKVKINIPIHLVSLLKAIPTIVQNKKYRKVSFETY